MCWSICEGSPAMSSRHAHSRFDRLGALICTCTVRGGPTGRRHTYWRSAIHSESEEETLVLCPLLVVARAARLEHRKHANLTVSELLILIMLNNINYTLFLLDLNFEIYTVTLK